LAEGSRRVVLAALAGNGAIALAKFVASAISASTAMLTEAIHSLVDAGDQVLLLVGQKRGEKPADATHPLGYGMEAYFWSFVVALMVFLVGGVLSITKVRSKSQVVAAIRILLTTADKASAPSLTRTRRTLHCKTRSPRRARECQPSDLRVISMLQAHVVSF